jgi:hypothetical protein
MQEDAGIVNALKYGATTTARNTTTLTAAVAAIGATPKTLMLSAGAWTLTANLTMPPTLTLWVPQGSTLDIDSGHTLTHQGPLKVDGCNHFTGAGTILLPAIAELNVCWFGATGQLDVDDTAAFQRAARALNMTPTGGHATGVGCCAPVFRIPAGSYKLTAPIQFTHGVSIKGHGPANTLLVAFNLAGNTFETGGMSGTAARFAVEDLTFLALTPKTAGAAILASTPNPLDDSQVQLFIHNVSCRGHFNCFDLQNSAYAHIVDNMLEDVRGTGIAIATSGNPDAGDNVIAHNVIAGAAGSVGISVRTAGQRIVNNKILAFSVGISVDPISTTVNDSDILIANNSIELQGTFGILVQTSALGGHLYHLQITSNQLALLQGGSPSASIALSGLISYTTIANNLITMAAQEGTYAILLSSNIRGETPSGWAITGNHIAAPNLTTAIGIQIPQITPLEYRGMVMGNYVTGLTKPYSGNTAAFIGGTFTSATLTGFGGPGSIVYCAGCGVTSGANNTCAGSGPGAMAMLTEAGWKCFNNQN